MYSTYCGNCGIYIAYGDSCIDSIENGHRKTLCQSCYDLKIQAKRDELAAINAKNNYIGQHLARARKLGLCADLTLEQWNETKAHFKNKCAYCESEEPICLEHFLPLSLEGGTTQSNCVPACMACNVKKKNVHPDLVKNIPAKSMERVRVFLATFKKS